MHPPTMPVVAWELLCRTAALKDELDWQPFLPGIDARWLYQTCDGGPAAALLRYQPGAQAPLHEHVGYEHVLVLDGAQTDQFGRAAAGMLRVHPPGSSHSVFSEAGCVVLIIWERRVRFLDDAVESMKG